MSAFKTLYRQKNLWVGLLAAAGVIAIFSFALLGSTVNPTPRDMPVALVMEDAGAKLPNGAEFNFGRKIMDSLIGSSAETGDAAVDSPIKWTVLNSRETAKEALDRQEYYAALIIPSDTTAKLLSLQTADPRPAQAEIWLNQGKSASGASMIGQALDKIMLAANTQLRQQLTGEIEKQGGMLNTAQAAMLSMPLTVKQTILNSIPANTANGNAPVAMTQLMWLGGLISAIMLLRAMGRTRPGKSRYGLIAAQISGGLLFGFVLTGVILLVNMGIIGLDIPDFWPVAGFLFLTFCSFFLLQATLLRFLGYAGIPLLMVLFFFGLPVLSLPYEFLPDITRNWFFTWVPFRFSVEGLRDLFFFRRGLGWSYPASVLLWIGLGGLLLMLLSPLAVKSKSSVEAKVTVEPE